MLEQWDRGQQVILRANPDYYGDAPLMDRVVVLFMEEDASLAAAQSGTADVAYTSAALAGAVPAGYTLLNCASVDSRGISLPCNPSGTDVTVEGDMVYAGGNDVTSDIAVRRALNYGIDRNQHDRACAGRLRPGGLFGGRRHALVKRGHACGNRRRGGRALAR